MKTPKMTLFALLTASLGAWAAEEQPAITQLKNLHIDTVLVAAGKPQAVIVVPGDGRYAAAVEAIQAAVRRASGATLPVERGAADAEALLKARNVIALGNMATNPFIAHMYRQWYTLLDLKYPGKGGCVVRSCHDPYGTGRNVIWIGGSDDAGVTAAARRFAGLLTPGAPLKVGWLMEIQLGAGLNPPEIGEHVKDWNQNTVLSWRDSWRVADGRKTGYPPGGAFGWNPISVAGVLYYMTGRREYLDYFKQLAMPDPKNVPPPLKTDDAIQDPLNPLVKNYHYRTHLVTCVFDLIEESPLFTDKERLHISNKLIEQYAHYTKGWGWNKPFKPHTPSRHGAWHSVCIYTTARYLAKYYPAARWNEALERVRETFAGFIGNPTWGESDTLVWVSTCLEPVFEFFMLDGFDEFVSSGTARTLMSGIEILWSGKKIDVSNQMLSLGLLHKAGHMLKDGRYAWLARQMDFDLDAFRIGQSFWPPETQTASPPRDRVNRVSHYPLPKEDWDQSGKTVPREEGFQMLSYRRGLTDRDDFLHIDGFMGGGRNPYHVNALYLLRLGAHELASGYDNQVQIWRNGMVAQQAAKAAALKKAAGFGAGAYVHTQVPNMPFSSWDRHVFLIGGLCAAVVDRVQAREPGTFEVRCGWNLPGAGKTIDALPRCVRTDAGVVLSCAQPVAMAAGGGQTWEGHLATGETIALHNLLYREPALDPPPYTLAALAPQASLVRGDRPGLVAVGPYDADPIRVQAAAAYVTADRILMVDAVELRAGRTPIVTCDEPLSLAWRLDSGTLEADATEPCTLTVATRPPQSVRLQPGRHERNGMPPDPAVAAALQRALAALAARAAPPADERPASKSARANWLPRWTARVKGRVTHVEPARHPAPMLWVAADDTRKEGSHAETDRFSRLYVMTPQGKAVKSAECPARILSLWPAADAEQTRSFAALAGLRDDRLRALDARGDLLWEARADVHPSFKIADRYEAPWFTDPRPPRDNRGVFALNVDDFWHTGKQTIALGRPCTVEFRELSGKLIERLRTDWGNNSVFAMLANSGQANGDGPARWLLAGREYAGNPRVTAFGAGYKTRVWAGYSPIEPGATWISGWRKRRLWHLLTADLDGDGVEEVIRGIGGIWNDVAVHKGADHENCLWSRSFGPGHMTSLVVARFAGDGKRQVVVVMASGWVCAFDHQGAPLWQRKLSSGATAACAANGHGVAVGCRDGSIALLNGRGETIRTARLDGTVRVLHAEGNTLFAGTDAGQVAGLGIGN
ncbi:MAG: hypothetical protein JXR37_03445 [Kiritimatiellae bacterium]|nr:hypothetical protein [Kiritimatiellia bacterium]